MCWVDFRKAFDSLSHQWIRRCLLIYRFADNLVSCISSMMDHWRTQMVLPGQTPRAFSRPISIHRGIFQGDSLSPLLFCPVSKSDQWRIDQDGSWLPLWPTSPGVPCIAPVVHGRHEALRPTQQESALHDQCCGVNGRLHWYAFQPIKVKLLSRHSRVTPLLSCRRRSPTGTLVSRNQPIFTPRN